MEIRKHVPKIRIPDNGKPKITPEVKPTELPDLDLRIALDDVPNLPIVRRSFKALANFVSRRFTGITIFKDSVQSIWDWIVRIIQLIITKLKGKDNE